MSERFENPRPPDYVLNRESRKTVLKVWNPSMELK